MQPNAIDYVGIQNTLAKYCVAVDTKDWDLLSEVFVEDVDAKYPLPLGDMKGVPAVAEAIKKRLKPITSQHALSTQTIEITQAGEAACATTYFTGVLFGKGKWQGQQVTSYGKYVDALSCFQDGPGKKLQGASGHWLVTRREVYYMGRIGEEGVMSGEDG